MGYEHDFMGIPGHIRESRGMDPNFREGGYRGMRMRAGPGQAAYGDYLRRHAGDLGGSAELRGGPRSLPGRAGRPARGYDRETRGYDREWGSPGGVRRWENRDLVRMYNANSEALRGEGRTGKVPARRLRHRYGNDFDYSNRGLAGGFAEGWIKPPTSRP